MRDGASEHLSSGLFDHIRVSADKPVSAGLDEFHPFGLVAQREARHAVEERLFLHAARIRSDQCRAHFEPNHIEIADRIDKRQSMLGP